MIRKVVLFFMLIPAFSWAICTNELTKVYHHYSSLGDKVVCYFSQEPICNRLPVKATQNDQEKTSLVLFMPGTTESVEAKTMIKKIQAAKRPYYSCAFQEVTKPIQGIKLTITYNPKKIVCNYETFDAITANKGIVFSFHNKEVLQELSSKTGQLLQYASNDATRKPRILLDYGHGGSDEGKVGCFNIKEKHINLLVGKKVAHLLTQRNCEVFVTRTNDCFVALDERTRYANEKKVDLFLSIHANAAQSNTIKGVETYWMNSALLKEGMTAADANVKNVIVEIRRKKDTLSHLLATSVHNHVLQNAQKKYHTIDRNVKESIAQVLLAEAPAALIEIGFLSNPEETKLLANDAYQTIIAQGIVSGILAYLNMRNQA